MTADEIMIEVAEPTKDATDELFAFQLPLLPRVALLPIVPARVYKAAWAGLSGEGNVVINARRAGVLVGSLCLYEAETPYSDETILRDSWFALADGEPEGGEVGKMLLDAAIAVADQREKVLLLTRINPGKHAKGFGLFAAVAGYIPMGKVIRIR